MNPLLVLGLKKSNQCSLYIFPFVIQAWKPENLITRFEIAGTLKIVILKDINSRLGSNVSNGS